jgi:hypothetical protein
LKYGKVVAAARRFAVLNLGHEVFHSRRFDNPDLCVTIQLQADMTKHCQVGV